MKHTIIALFLLLSLTVSAKIPTKQEVYNEILAVGIKFPDIALAQAILESGSFTSKLAKYNHNLFGMRLAKVRKTTAIGKQYGYAKYKTWKDSVKDYKLWQDRYFNKDKNMSRQKYMSILNNIYSQTSSYVQRIKIIIKTNKNKYEEDNTLFADSIFYASDSVWIKF